ncbi:MAG: protein adenylyltransferase SelO [Iamia sp.]
MSVTPTATTQTPRAVLGDLDHAFARELPELSVEWQAEQVPEPSLVVLNEPLARDLGADPAWLRSPAGVAVLSGNVVPDGARPVAMAYAGHQFGSYNPRLGDGRALLLGEVVDQEGTRRDVHLKGSGRTPFARRGDGKATVGPMLREHLIAEALCALGVPTTRALAVVTTGEQVVRSLPEPGAVLTRVAASHIRVGTFEHAARLDADDLVRRLADHAIARDHPEAAADAQPHQALLAAVVDAQADLVAHWMLLGFIHGVMNTDNMTISGEGIDYGPCAFMDRFDPATVFSSIDHGGRYAFGNQPNVAQWNLARLAETLLPLLADDPDAAVDVARDVLGRFGGRFDCTWREGMRAKLGLVEAPTDAELFDDLLALQSQHGLDHTSTYRDLARPLRADAAPSLPGRMDPAAVDAWASRWRSELAREGRDPALVASEMDAVNPIYVPRNHLVEEALGAATAGDREPFGRLTDVLADPYVERPGQERYAAPAPDDFAAGFRTFCGT